MLRDSKSNPEALSGFVNSIHSIRFSRFPRAASRPAAQDGILGRRPARVKDVSAIRRIFFRMRRRFGKYPQAAPMVSEGALRPGNMEASSTTGPGRAKRGRWPPSQRYIIGIDPINAYIDEKMDARHFERPSHQSEYLRKQLPKHRKECRHRWEPASNRQPRFLPWRLPPDARLPSQARPRERSSWLPPADHQSLRPSDEQHREP